MSLINEIKRDIKTAMTIRPPGWSVLCVAIAVGVAFPLFDSVGKLYLIMPILASIAVLVVTIFIKWKLKTFAWFWITMAVLVTFHIVLIVFVPWTSNWVPAFVTAGIASIDLFVMLAVVDAIARLMKRVS